MKPDIEAKILGQILLMQSILTNLPDQKSIFEFIIHGLKDIPGIKNIEIENKKVNESEIQFGIPISISKSNFGYLNVTLSNSESFSPYTDYLKNFVFTVAVILEERRLRKKDKENKVILEQNVQKRTIQLRHEINDRIEAQNSLKKSEKKFRLLAENSLDMISQNSPEGNFIYVSPSCKLLLEYEPEELNNKNICDLIHEEDIKSFKHDLTILLNRKKHTFSYRIRKKNGTYIWFESNCRYIADQSQELVPEIQFSSRDISERKRAEEALNEYQHALKAQNEEYLALNEELSENNEKILLINEELVKSKEKAEESDRLKSSFLANMSHEVRTPMNAIIGFSDLLTDKNIDEKKRNRCAYIIRKRSYDLLRIVEDILDISKIEVGQFKIFETEFTLNDLLYELNDYYQEKIKEKEKIDFSFNLSIPNNTNILNIKTDQQRLKQVLTNLIDNALKFTDHGSVEFGYNINNNSDITFFVKDTGIGIAEEKKELIFDRFRTAEETISARQYGGTGLGLSIVKGIISLLKGKIWVQSELGKGAQFYFTIPIVEAKTMTSPQEKEKYSFNDILFSQSILVIEDDPTNIEYLVEIFDDSECNIKYAKNGTETVKLLTQLKSLNLVLLDLRLPDIDGLSLIPAIKKYFPETIIIAQTAYAGAQDQKRCLDAGCDSFISKPLNKNKLISVIESYFPEKPQP